MTIVSRPATDEYRKGFVRVFRAKKIHTDDVVAPRTPWVPEKLPPTKHVKKTKRP